MEKVKINNQVIRMRNSVRRSRLFIKRKLTRNIKLLEERQNKTNNVKLQRKIERTKKEVEFIRKLDINEVILTALKEQKEWKKVLLQKDSSMEDRCLAHLISHKIIQNEIRQFLNQNPELQSCIPLVLEKWDKKKLIKRRGIKDENDEDGDDTVIEGGDTTIERDDTAIDGGDDDDDDDDDNDDDIEGELIKIPNAEKSIKKQRRQKNKKGLKKIITSVSEKSVKKQKLQANKTGIKKTPLGSEKSVKKQKLQANKKGMKKSPISTLQKSAKEQNKKPTISGSKSDDNIIDSIKNIPVKKSPNKLGVLDKVDGSMQILQINLDKLEKDGFIPLNSTSQIDKTSLPAKRNKDSFFLSGNDSSPDQSGEDSTDEDSSHSVSDTEHSEPKKMKTDLVSSLSDDKSKNSPDKVKPKFSPKQDKGPGKNARRQGWNPGRFNEGRREKFGKNSFPNNRKNSNRGAGLHPSWEAKRKQKVRILPFMGKKIKFDD